MALHQIVAVFGLILCVLYLSFQKQLAEMVGPQQGSDPGIGMLRVLASVLLFVFGPVVAYIVAGICILMALIP